MKGLLVLALVFAVSAFAYAETQSVKVSGDIRMDAFARGNFDLDSNEAEPQTGEVSNQWATYLMSTAEVQIDADLTDNVAGCVRLVNQRVWGDDNYTNYANANGELMRKNVNQVANTFTVGTGNDQSFQVNVDLAYIELKEFLYSPLTLKIGRQDLWFGKGFIVGANLQSTNGSIYAQEYTAIRSFDAIRATLDYDPWTIDAVYAKISENARLADDDVDLMGVNVGYLFDSMNGEMEGYYWWKQSRNPGATQGTSLDSMNGKLRNDVHTIGIRGSFDPIEDWTIAAEGAYQMGKYLNPVLGAPQQVNRDRSAWAVDAMLECRYFQENFAWRPLLNAEFIWYSGQTDALDANATTAGKYKGWDSMFRGKFDTKIREYQNIFYNTAVNSTAGDTNEFQLLGSISVEPTDSLTCSAQYAYFWLQRPTTQTATATTSRGKQVGGELDLIASWDYTEDVQFGILAAWFFPGNAYDSTTINSDVATDIVGTVSLSF
ncbi:MAG: alginate export family protein [Candidatus Omnitrophica bacterium]|nr:alginate export family protein [Candidatus Omnitrophota bacterium]